MARRKQPQLNTYNVVFNGDLPEEQKLSMSNDNERLGFALLDMQSQFTDTLHTSVQNLLASRVAGIYRATYDAAVDRGSSLSMEEYLYQPGVIAQMRDQPLDFSLAKNVQFQLNQQGKAAIKGPLWQMEPEAFGVKNVGQAIDWLARSGGTNALEHAYRADKLYGSAMPEEERMRDSFQAPMTSAMEKIFTYDSDQGQFMHYWDANIRKGSREWRQKEQGISQSTRSMGLFRDDPQGDANSFVDVAGKAFSDLYGGELPRVPTPEEMGHINPLKVAQGNARANWGNYADFDWQKRTFTSGGPDASTWRVQNVDPGSALGMAFAKQGIDPAKGAYWVGITNATRQTANDMASTLEAGESITSLFAVPNEAGGLDAMDVDIQGMPFSRVYPAQTLKEQQAEADQYGKWISNFANELDPNRAAVRPGQPRVESTGAYEGFTRAGDRPQPGRFSGAGPVEPPGLTPNPTGQWVDAPDPSTGEIRRVWQKRDMGHGIYLPRNDEATTLPAWGLAGSKYFAEEMADGTPLRLDPQRTPVYSMGLSDTSEVVVSQGVASRGGSPMPPGVVTGYTGPVAVRQSPPQRYPMAGAYVRSKEMAAQGGMWRDANGKLQLDAISPKQTGEFQYQLTMTPGEMRQFDEELYGPNHKQWSQADAFLNETRAKSKQVHMEKANRAYAQSGNVDPAYREMDEKARMEYAWNRLPASERQALVSMDLREAARKGLGLPSGLDKAQWRSGSTVVSAIRNFKNTMEAVPDRPDPTEKFPGEPERDITGFTAEIDSMERANLPSVASNRAAALSQSRQQWGIAKRRAIADAQETQAALGEEGYPARGRSAVDQIDAMAAAHMQSMSDTTYLRAPQEYREPSDDWVEMGSAQESRYQKSTVAQNDPNAEAPIGYASGRGQNWNSGRGIGVRPYVNRRAINPFAAKENEGVRDVSGDYSTSLADRQATASLENTIALAAGKDTIGRRFAAVPEREVISRGIDIRSVLTPDEQTTSYATYGALQGRKTGGTLMDAEAKLNASLEILQRRDPDAFARTTMIGRYNEDTFATFVESTAMAEGVDIAYTPGQDAQFANDFAALAQNNAKAAQRIARLFPSRAQQTELAASEIDRLQNVPENLAQGTLDLEVRAARKILAARTRDDEPLSEADRATADAARAAYRADPLQYEIDEYGKKIETATGPTRARYEKYRNQLIARQQGIPAEAAMPEEDPGFWEAMGVTETKPRLEIRIDQEAARREAADVRQTFNLEDIKARARALREDRSTPQPESHSAPQPGDSHRYAEAGGRAMAKFSPNQSRGSRKRSATDPETGEWREVDPNVPQQPGGEYRLDMESGKSYVRTPPSNNTATPPPARSAAGNGGSGGNGNQPPEPPPPDPGDPDDAYWNALFNQGPPEDPEGMWNGTDVTGFLPESQTPAGPQATRSNGSQPTNTPRSQNSAPRAQRANRYRNPRTENRGAQLSGDKESSWIYYHKNDEAKVGRQVGKFIEDSDSGKNRSQFFFITNDDIGADHPLVEGLHRSATAAFGHSGMSIGPMQEIPDETLDQGFKLWGVDVTDAGRQAASNLSPIQRMMRIDEIDGETEQLRTELGAIPEGGDIPQDKADRLAKLQREKLLLNRNDLGTPATGRNATPRPQRAVRPSNTRQRLFPAGDTHLEPQNWPGPREGHTLKWKPLGETMRTAVGKIDQGTGEVAWFEQFSDGSVSDRSMDSDPRYGQVWDKDQNPVADVSQADYGEFSRGSRANLATRRDAFLNDMNRLFNERLMMSGNLERHNDPSTIRQRLGKAISNIGVESIRQQSIRDGEGDNMRFMTDSADPDNAIYKIGTKDKIFADHGMIQRSHSTVQAAAAQAIEGNMPMSAPEAVATLKERIDKAVWKAVEDGVKADLEEGKMTESQARAKGSRTREVMNKYRDEAVEVFAKELGAELGTSESASDLVKSAGRISSRDAKLSPRGALELATTDKRVRETIGDQDPLKIIEGSQKFLVSDESGDSFNIGGLGKLDGAPNRQAPRMGGALGMFMGGSGGMGGLGSMFYGAYMLRREWQMAAAPVLQSASKYAEGLGEYAPLLYEGNAMAGSDAGFAYRQEAGEAFMGRAAYSSFGAFMDIPYRLSKSGNMSAARGLQSIGIAGGLAGGGLIGGSMLTMSGMAVAGGALATGGVVVGGALLAGTAAMEAYNQWWKPEGEEDLTYSTIFDGWNESQSLMKANAARIGQKYGSNYEEFSARTKGTSQWLSKGDWNVMRTVEKMPGATGKNLSFEELKPWMTDEEISTREEKDTAQDLAAKVSAIRADTLEEESAIVKALQVQKRFTGGYDTELLTQVSKTSAAIGVGSDESLQQGTQYATQLGHVEGTTDFKRAMYEYAGLDSAEKRAGAQYSAARVSQLGSQVQAVMGTGAEFNGLGARLVQAYGLTNQQQIGAFSSMASGMQQYGADFAPWQYNQMASIARDNGPFVASTIGSAMQGLMTGGATQSQAMSFGMELSGLGMNNQQAFMYNRMLGGDMRAMSYQAWQNGTYENRMYDQAGNAIWETNGGMAMNWVQGNMDRLGALPSFQGMQGLSGAGLASAITGSSKQKIIDAFMQHGTRGIESLARESSARAQMAQAGIQLKGIELQENYLWGDDSGGTWNSPTRGSLWGIEDRQKAMQDASIRAGFAEQEQRMEMSNRYSIARENNQMSRMQVNWGFQDWQFSQQYNQFQQQQTWARKDWQYQDTMRGLNNAWSMEDINENIRFSSGRQRRQLVRQRDRMALTQNLEGEQVETQRDRQKQLWAQEEERFQKQKQYNDELRRLDVESFELNKSQREDFYKMDKESLARKMKEYEEEKKLQEELTKLQRKYQYEQLQLSKEAAGASAAAAAEQLEYSEALRKTNEKMSDGKGMLEQINSYDNAWRVARATQEMMASIDRVNISNVDRIIEMLRQIGTTASSGRIPIFPNDDSRQ